MVGESAVGISFFNTHREAIMKIKLLAIFLLCELLAAPVYSSIPFKRGLKKFLNLSPVQIKAVLKLDDEQFKTVMLLKRLKSLSIGQFEGIVKANVETIKAIKRMDDEPLHKALEHLTPHQRDEIFWLSKEQRQAIKGLDDELHKAIDLLTYPQFEAIQKLSDQQIILAARQLDDEQLKKVGQLDDEQLEALKALLNSNNYSQGG